MKIRPFSFLVALSMLLTGCTTSRPQFTAEVIPVPSGMPPQLKVYVADAGQIITMDVEAYVSGVVAGEMKNDWPIEALKAQAILARTFVLKFISEKESRYPGADISTDIAEAQAYNAVAINHQIATAVRETAGEILLLPDGTLPYTWFHSHSGGTTALAREGLDWQGDEPSFTVSMPGGDSPDAPDSARAWHAVFTREEFISACQSAGAAVSTCDTITVSQRGNSGRAVTLLVDGVPVNAARLRISLGSTVMRSTLLTELTIRDGMIRMSGRGYGHGVGMPQWGAYALAQAGMSGEEIALHYYKNLRLVKAW